MALDKSAPHMIISEEAAMRRYGGHRSTWWRWRHQFNLTTIIIDGSRWYILSQLEACYQARDRRRRAA